MSKYIRTKDGIYDFEEQRGNIENRGERSFLAIGNDYRGCTCYDYEEIINQADTIDELCDGFYWDWEDKFSPHNFYSYSLAKDIWGEYINDCLEENEKPDRNMYGCIKTDKGLIYVAKMNEEGELVLI